MRNTKAKFSNKIKEAIYERDGGVCFNCWNPWTDCHHVLYGLQSERTTDRNDINKGLLCCRDCHNIIHSCKSWTWLREEAINFLKNIVCD